MTVSSKLETEERSGCQSTSNLFGGSPEDVTHSPSVTQPLVQHRDDAHEQGVTHALYPVVFHCDTARRESASVSAGLLGSGGVAVGADSYCGSTKRKGTNSNSATRLFEHNYIS